MKNSGQSTREHLLESLLKQCRTVQIIKNCDEDILLLKFPILFHKKVHNPFGAMDSYKS